MRRLGLVVLLLGWCLVVSAQELKSPAHQALDSLLERVDAPGAHFSEEEYQQLVSETLENFAQMAASSEKYQGIPVKFLGSRLALQVGNVLLHRHARMEDARLITKSAQSVYSPEAGGQAALMHQALAGTRKGFTELAGEDQFRLEGAAAESWGPREQGMLFVGGVLLLAAVVYLIRNRREAPADLTVVDARLQQGAQTSLSLGLRLLQEDRVEEATRYFQKVAELETTLRGRGQYFLALVNLQQGETEKARTLIDELDFQQLDPEQGYELGDELERRGQTLIAKRVFEKVYLGDMHFKDVKERLERLREETASYSEEDVATILAERILEPRFEDVQLVASGGMGFVFSVRDQQREGQKLALKVLSPFYANNEEAYTRFIQEARGLSEIRHPNIIRIHDVFEKSLPYFTMDFYDSPDLKAVLAEAGRLPLERAKRIGLQLCQALHAAHRIGVVHRDVKPSNLLLDDQDHVTLLDFGIARFGDGGGLTLTGQVLGSPRYMAPEQHAGDDVDQRCDIYSAGVILYLMLVGELPPASPGGIVQGEYPPLPTEVGAPPELAEVLTSALRSRREERPESLLPLIQVLRSGQKHGLEADS